MQRSGRPPEVRRIVDRPEDHEAPGAWDWGPAARRRRDADAAFAAHRFLAEAAGVDGCWRCEVAAAAGSLGLCPPCLDELRTG